MIQAIMISTFDIGSVLIALATFGTYVTGGGTLTAAIVFPSVTLFTMLDYPLGLLALVFNMVWGSKVSLNRIQKFMDSEEKDNSAHCK